MLSNAIQVGQKFHWKSRSNGDYVGTAIVKSVRSDQEQGMSTEVEDYAAIWIEAQGESGSLANQAFTVLLGTDGNSYLEGREISVEIT